MTKYLEYNEALICISDEAAILQENHRKMACIQLLHPNDSSADIEAAYAVYDLEAVDEELQMLVVKRFKKEPIEIIRQDELVIREICATDEKSVNELLRDLEKDSFTIDCMIIDEYVRFHYDYDGFGIWGIEIEGELVGLCGFKKQAADWHEGYTICERENGDFSLELGYVIAAERRNRRLATRSCELLLEYVNANLQYKRVGAVIAKDNAASLAVYQNIIRATRQVTSQLD